MYAGSETLASLHIYTDSKYRDFICWSICCLFRRSISQNKGLTDSDLDQRVNYFFPIDSFVVGTKRTVSMRQFF